MPARDLVGELGGYTRELTTPYCEGKALFLQPKDAWVPL